MERIVASLILLAAAASAETTKTPEGPTIEKIEITEYGVYSASVQESKRDAKGILKSTLGEIKLAEQTRLVPMRLGVRFGIRFKPVGTPDGAHVEIKKVTTFPPGGLKKPSGETLTESRSVLKKDLGTASYTDYGFDDPWELVEGDWTIELFDGDRKLASETFTVYDESRGVDSEPPPAQPENVQVRAGFVWIRGNQAYQGGKWNWVSGHWERAREGKMWQDGRWEKRGSKWFRVEGSWTQR